MKYTVEIEINLARDRVSELFDSTDNLFQWQEELQKFEHVSGEPGQPGACSRLEFLHEGRSLELIETITERRLPDEFNGRYECDGVVNEVRN